MILESRARSLNLTKDLDLKLGKRYSKSPNFGPIFPLPYPKSTKPKSPL